MSKTHSTIAILLLMVFLLMMNSIFSCRENFMEGLETMDPSGSALTSLMTKASSAVQDASAAGLPIAAVASPVPIPAQSDGFVGDQKPVTTEGFDNIFGNHYSSATNWNNTNSDFFKNVPFKPECCNNSSMSNSSGCACLPPNKVQFLQHHGNNN